MLSKILRVSFHSVMGWAGNNICSQTIQKEIRTRQHVPGHFWIGNYFFTDSASVHTYPRNPACESATFWIRSPERKFLNTYESGIVWTLNPYIFFIQWRHKIQPSSLPRILKTVPSAMLSLFYGLDFSFKFYNVCAVKPSYDYCAPQLCQTAARHFKAFIHVGPTNWTP